MREAPRAAAVAAAAVAVVAAKMVKIDPPPRETFLFFPAQAAVPEIRSVPGKDRAAGAASRTNIDAIWIGLVTIATLFAGIAASIAIVRFGGTGLWVVKRSAVAWSIGMMTAAGMIFCIVTAR